MSTVSISETVDVFETVDVALLHRAVAFELTYLVPEHLRTRMRPGDAVIVPLQRSLVAGVVTALGAASAQAKLRELHSRIDEMPALYPHQLAMARQLAVECVAPLGAACALMIPPGLTPASSDEYTLADPFPGRLPPPGSVAARVVAVLREHGPLLRGALARRLRGVAAWRLELQRLVDAGCIVRAAALAPAGQAPRKGTLVQLTISDITLELALEKLASADAFPRMRPEVRARRASLLHALQRSAGIAWADWLLVESGARREDLSWLAEQEWIDFGSAARWRDPLSETDYIVRTAPVLTVDQQCAWDAISARPDGAFVLRGPDGSGKTEIYMRAVAAALERGAGAIILVPEIDLAPALARRFLERFPGKVALIHSRLKPAERFAIWRRIRAGELAVVIGARSALFAPLPRIGLIVVDQEHDDSYKQPDFPRVDVRRAARTYAAQLGATLILGSATPTLEALYLALSGGAVLLDLPQRVRAPALRLAAWSTRFSRQSIALPETDAVSSQPLPSVELVDMRVELRAGNLSMFSRAMQQGLAETLARREQAMLFLNRRGAGSIVACRDCGHVLRCPRDDSPLAWHGADVRCHVCTHRQPSPERCPQCGGRRIRHFGVGTLSVEEEVRRRFPLARIVRIDRDAAEQPGAVEQLMRRFVTRQADVLVGARRLAKGADLPLVSFVGVVLADVGLFLPDFRAGERALQLLESVAARAGAAFGAGRVVVQTYNPEHAALRAAAAHDVDGFARRELEQRRRLRLPPYTRLVRFLCVAADESAARAQATGIAHRLRALVPADAIIGPAACFFTRRAGRSRWQVLVRTDAPPTLLAQLDLPRDAAVIVDVDPVSVL